MRHELGHRMETAIPGLTAMEFALARSRATVNGVLEPLAEMQGMADEFTYADKWREAYAGKNYASPGDTRPDKVPHEVFQTGTQDLFNLGSIGTATMSHTSS